MSGFGFVPEIGADFRLFSLALLKNIFCSSVELEQISSIWKVIKNWVDWRRNKWFNHVTTAAQVGFYHLDLQLLTLVCNAGLLSSMHWHSASPMWRQVSCQCHMWQKLALGAQESTWDNQLLPQQTHMSCGIETSFMQVGHVLKVLDLMLWSCVPEQWGTRVQPRAACSEAESLSTTHVRHCVHTKWWPEPQRAFRN